MLNLRLLQIAQSWNSQEAVNMAFMESFQRIASHPFWTYEASVYHSSRLRLMYFGNMWELNYISLYFLIYCSEFYDTQNKSCFVLV
jgi:hypothetical protein